MVKLTRRRLRRKHPKIADELFHALVQTIGGVIIVALATFLERLLASLGFRKSHRCIEDEAVENEEALPAELASTQEDNGQRNEVAT